MLLINKLVDFSQFYPNQTKCDTSLQAGKMLQNKLVAIRNVIGINHS